jgi:hypothetical protein
MRVCCWQVMRWMTVLLAPGAVGLTAESPAAWAAGDNSVPVTQASSDSWSGVVLGIFLVAAVLLVLWRVVLFLFAVALVGLVLLGLVVLLAGGPATHAGTSDAVFTPTSLVSLSGVPC